MLTLFITIQDLDSDYNCMQQLYTSTNGDNWFNKDNWTAQSNDSSIVCDFYGITCNINKTQINTISLASNNLNGALPTCFDSLSLISLTLDNNNLSTTNISGSFIGNISYSLSMANTNAKLYGNVSFNGQSLNMKNTDLSRLYLDCTNTNLSSIDLTNSSVWGKFTPSKYYIRDFYLSNTNLEVELDENIQSYTQTIDAGNTLTKMQLRDVINVWNKVQTLHILNLKNSRISGANDDFDGELYSENSTRVIDLSGNPLMCGVNFTSPIECVFLQVKQVSAQDDKVLITFTHNNRVKLAEVPQNIEFYAREVNTTNSPQQFQNCQFVKVVDYMFTYQCDALSFMITNVSQVGIRMNGNTVSTGDVFVIDELTELLGATQQTQTEQKQYHKNLIKHPRSYIPKSQQTILKEEHEKYINVQVTAYSKCPDFKSIQQELFEPFRIKYPEIAQYLNYEYVSMAKVDRQYFTQATSMHGLYEAYTDLLYLCLQDKVDNELLWQVIDCQQDNDRCVDLVPDKEQRLDIELCQGNEEGLYLLKQSQEKVTQLNASWSPGVYFDDQFICNWDTYESDECRITSFKDADEFAKYVCNYNDNMKQADVCQNFI